MIWMLLLVSQDLKLAEIEVERVTKPKPEGRFKWDEDAYVLRLSWRGGNDPGVARPSAGFGAMTRQQARSWALGVVADQFDGDWTDLSHPQKEPDAVKLPEGRVVPAGWGLDFIQSHQGVPFDDPDDPSARGGVFAQMNDDPGGEEGPASAYLTVRRWKVSREHGTPRAVQPREKVVAAFVADYRKAHPKTAPKEVSVDAILTWAVKPGAADRRVPVWCARLKGPSAGPLGKPTIRRYRADAWTGTIQVAEAVAIPGE